LAALFGVAGREPQRAGSFDLGFALGPRVNAAGRLADMRLGIELLVTDDYARALNIAQELDQLNRARREVEDAMRRDAEAMIAAVATPSATSLVLYDERWHQGVVGLLAGRLKDRDHVPVIALAPAGDDLARGSGRSIPGLHLRDTLDLVSKREPDLIQRFGGHAAAAGLTLRVRDIDRFRVAFDAAVRTLADESIFARAVETDGSLEPQYATLEVARLMDGAVWGQGFPAPVFCDEFAVERQKLVGAKHLKLKVVREGGRYDAMLFRHETPLPDRVRAAYSLAIDEWNGTQAVALRFEHVEAL
jgi:single-stranded-DNA-specific exonuclease